MFMLWSTEEAMAAAVQCARLAVLPNDVRFLCHSLCINQNLVVLNLSRSHSTGLLQVQSLFFFSTTSSDVAFCG